MDNLDLHAALGHTQGPLSHGRKLAISTHSQWQRPLVTPNILSPFLLEK